MSDLRIFNNQEFGEIRALELDGEPWFVGKDVAEILGYVNSRKAIIDHVDEEDKTDGVTIRDTIGREQNPVCINESGLYSLILSSKLPTAKKFKRWVTSEVLPTIRKHDGYLTPSAIEQTLSNPDFIIKLATELKAERENKQRLEKQLELDRPKVLFADAVSVSDSTILIGELAKILKGNGIDIGQNRMFAKLRSDGYLIKRQGTDYNTPTQRAMELGLFKVKETALTHSDGHVTVTKTTKVTGKGQQYFINLFVSERKLNETVSV